MQVQPPDAVSTATPIVKPAIDEGLSRQEVFLMRRLRNIRNDALTSTHPAIVTIHIDGDGTMTWFVAGKGEGTNSRLTTK